MRRALRALALLTAIQLIVPGSPALARSTPCFGMPSAPEGGINVRALAAGDFNLDGDLDLAPVINPQGDFSIQLLHNGGAGSFSGASSGGSVANAPQAIVTGDFNDDGDLDLAVVVDAGSGSDTVSVLRGVSNHDFAAAGSFSLAAGSNPRAIAVGDFNRDGKLDLAVANNGTDDVAILLSTTSAGAASVTFNPPATVAAGDGPTGLVADDFNLDGKLDLAVSLGNTNNLAVLLGNGDGTFAAATAIAAGGPSSSLATGDFNRDGRPDLAVGRANAGTVAILLRNESSGFGAATSVSTSGSSVRAVVTGDFNGDGNLDVAAATSAGASVLLGNGDGSFTAGGSFAVGPNPSDLVAGDFDRDGTLDLAVGNDTTDDPNADANGRTRVLLNDCNDPPTITLPATLPQSVNEDQNLRFSTAGGNPIQVGDPDAGTNPVQVTLSMPGGSRLTLNGTTGLTFVLVDDGTTVSLHVTGAIPNVNAALDGLEIVPPPNFNGTTALTISVDDRGNSGSNGAKSAAAVVPIRVNPRNDPPTNTVPGPQATDEDTPLVFSAGRGNEIRVADTEGPTVRVTLAAANGVLTLSRTTGLSFTAGDGTADAAMTFIGLITNVNSALDDLRFDPTPNFSGTASVQITTNDLNNVGGGGAPDITNAASITVRPVNDPPTITDIANQTLVEDTSTGPLAFTVGDAEIPADSLVVTASSDNPTLAPNGPASLAVGGSGPNRTLTVTPAANQFGAATITVTVADGQGGTVTDTFLLIVNDADEPAAPNAAPIARDDAFVAAVGAPLTVAAPGVLANDSDPEGTAISAILVSRPAQGTLALAADGGFIYVPGRGYRGRDGFSYRVSDGSGSSAVVGVTITTPTCFGRLATIVGTAGNDALNGTPGDDVIHGLGGNDAINGLAGNDRLCGGEGNDRITGGPGDDLLDGENGNDTLDTGPGNDTALGRAGDDRIFGGAGNDRLFGGIGNDRAFGGPGNDRVVGEAGNDVLGGDGGNDTLVGGPGRDNCSGGANVDSAATCEALNSVP